MKSKAKKTILLVSALAVAGFLWLKKDKKAKKDQEDEELAEVSMISVVNESVEAIDQLQLSKSSVILESFCNSKPIHSKYCEDSPECFNQPELFVTESSPRTERASLPSALSPQPFLKNPLKKPKNLPPRAFLKIEAPEPKGHSKSKVLNQSSASINTSQRCIAKPVKPTTDFNLRALQATSPIWTIGKSKRKEIKNNTPGPGAYWPREEAKKLNKRQSINIKLADAPEVSTFERQGTMKSKTVSLSSFTPKPKAPTRATCISPPLNPSPNPIMTSPKSTNSLKSRQNFLKQAK